MARPLTAFAFRVHTHAMGREVFLERMVAGQMTPTNATAQDGSGPVWLMGGVFNDIVRQYFVPLFYFYQAASLGSIRPVLSAT